MTKAALALAGLLLLGTAFSAAEVRDAPLALERMRQQGDLVGQRDHAWALFATLTRADKNGRPQFENWHGEDALFSNAASSERGIAGFSRTSDGGLKAEAPDVPVLTYTLYDDAAFDHIMRYRLNSVAGLEALRKKGAPGVPAFPAKAMVLKTAWWPVAKEGLTAMPVWDPESNPPRRNGNPYTSWQRAVAVDPSNQGPATARISFAGRDFAAAHRIGIGALYHVTVDGAMAWRMMRDPTTAKAVTIALGRPLQQGDYLALVAANLAAREVPDWIWAAYWWHDRPEQGAFAAGRPPTLAPVFRNYLMQPAFDAEKPVTNGQPHIAFDPWLEGRFPDGGHGGGVASNCMACHQRASYPKVAFLPVTRGAPDPDDPAEAPGRLGTSFLWSLAMHAKTGTP